MDPRRALAKIAVEAGLGIGDGSMLRVQAEHPHRELMHMVAEEAYDRGARLVRLDYDDDRLTRIRVDHSRDQHIDAVSQMLEKDSEIYVQEGWSLLAIDGYESATTLQGASPDRLTRMQRARGKAVTALRKAQMSNRLAWCVIPAATTAWARTVLGPEGTVEALWEVLVPILRLDAPDPAAAIRAHMTALETRAGRLTELALRELRFVGPGTDLRVAIAPESVWIGGPDRGPGGRVFYANLPTEEVFTTPDFRGTEGQVTSTRPLRIHGSLVEGARLVFRAGVVVESGARRGADVLERFLETDTGARRLGEVALVDSTSPIWRSGHVFDSMLLDENAACHIAVGAAYDPAFRGSEGLTDEEKAGRGFNVSITHEDMMIGSEEMSVTGKDSTGREIPIIRTGRFALPR